MDKPEQQFANTQSVALEDLASLDVSEIRRICLAGAQTYTDQEIRDLLWKVFAPTRDWRQFLAELRPKLIPRQPKDTNAE